MVARAILVSAKAGVKTRTVMGSIHLGQVPFGEGNVQRCNFLEIHKAIIAAISRCDERICFLAAGISGRFGDGGGGSERSAGAFSRRLDRAPLARPPQMGLPSSMPAGPTSLVVRS